MSSQEKYVIGPGLRTGLREVVDYVRSQPTRIESGTPDPVVQHPVRIPRLYRGTFNGPWAIGATQTVRYVNDTGSTVAVTNYCVGVTQSTGATSAVIFATVLGTATVIEIQHTGSTGVLQVGTFDGSWPKGTEKTVTVLGTGETTTVKNWCVTVPACADTATTRHVVFGATGTTPAAAAEIEIGGCTSTCGVTITDLDLTTLPGYEPGVIQLLGHSAADLSTNATACATLTWYSVTTCGTTV